MTCSNWMLTIFAVIILIVTFWPSWLGATADTWITIIAAILIVVTAWTGVDCRYCKKAKKK